MQNIIKSGFKQKYFKRIHKNSNFSKPSKQLHKFVHIKKIKQKTLTKATNLNKKILFRYIMIFNINLYKSIISQSHVQYKPFYSHTKTKDLNKNDEPAHYKIILLFIIIN